MNINQLVIPFPLFATLSCSMTSSFEQYGSMHEAIGKQEHQARVGLDKFTHSKHYVGLGALEKLQGEITILDGNIISTVVNKSGRAIPLKTREETKATLLIAEKITNWRKIKVKIDLAKEDFEVWLSEQVKMSSLDKKKRFMFKVEGEFINLHTHVINGACPVHARINRIYLSGNNKPYEKTFKRRRGILVGVHALDSTGKITHPDTNIHAHFVYKNEKNEYLTGHVETSGVSKGSVLFLPQN